MLQRSAASKKVPLARFRSTTAGTSSIVEAKSRVLEHARRISRTSAKNAQPAPAVYVSLIIAIYLPLISSRRPTSTPIFPTRTNVPYQTPPLAQEQNLDHSFIGKTGGEIFHEMMLRHRVKHIFGYPGGAILPVFDAIYNSPHFKFILPRHEQGAGHMAEGYARVSGKPGVVLVTSGPGATNVVTAMQDALSDGLPLVVFTGQVATSAIGSDAFQEADVIGISRSCTKWNVMVKDITELPRRINEAFKIATSGRPGPVLVDLPKDVTAGILRTPLPFKATTPGRPLGLPKNPLQPKDEVSIDMLAIKQAADLINGAQRPIIYAGNGVLSSPLGPTLLAKLSEIGNIPVTTTLQGLGAFDESSERSLHMIGMHGSAYANLAIQNADVIITLGARFDDRVTGKVDTFAPAARAAAISGRGGIIHFEILPKNVNKVVEAQIPILGDVVAGLNALVPLIRSPASIGTAGVRDKWMGEIKEWKRKYPFTYDASKPGEHMKPQEVIEELDRQLSNDGNRKEDTVITTGVGQHQMWAAQHYRWKVPRSMVTSGGLGVRSLKPPVCLFLERG